MKNLKTALTATTFVAAFALPAFAQTDYSAMTCAEFAAMDADGMAMAAEALGGMAHDAMSDEAMAADDTIAADDTMAADDTTAADDAMVDDMSASIMKACDGMADMSVMEAIEAAM